MEYFKAFIRVVKSLNGHNGYGNYFGAENVIEERLILAENKETVKKMLAEKYPSFFANGKVYERESKDKAQFFYVVIYPLFKGEREIVEANINWTCAHCNTTHENEYVSRPIVSHKLNGLKFCKKTDCFEKYKIENPIGFEGDDLNYVNAKSPNYIYKITEKLTGKCYVGKTRNAPFFRWWNHLTHSSSPFGLYLRNTSLSEWTFEVLQVLPAETLDNEIFKIESEYIIKFNSINNGYNTLISNKSVNEAS